MAVFQEVYSTQLHALLPVLGLDLLEGRFVRKRVLLVMQALVEVDHPGQPPRWDRREEAL